MGDLFQSQNGNQLFKANPNNDLFGGTPAKAIAASVFTSTNNSTLLQSNQLFGSNRIEPQMIPQQQQSQQKQNSKNILAYADPNNNIFGSKKAAPAELFSFNNTNSILGSFPVNNPLSTDQSKTTTLSRESNDIFTQNKGNGLFQISSLNVVQKKEENQSIFPKPVSEVLFGNPKATNGIFSQGANTKNIFPTFIQSGSEQLQQPQQLLLGQQTSNNPIQVIQRQSEVNKPLLENKVNEIEPIAKVNSDEQESSSNEEIDNQLLQFDRFSEIERNSSKLRNAESENEGENSQNLLDFGAKATKVSEENMVDFKCGSLQFMPIEEKKTLIDEKIENDRLKTIISTLEQKNNAISKKLLAYEQQQSNLPVQQLKPVNVPSLPSDSLTKMASLRLQCTFLILSNRRLREDHRRTIEEMERIIQAETQNKQILSEDIQYLKESERLRMSQIDATKLQAMHSSVFAENELSQKKRELQRNIEENRILKEMDAENRRKVEGLELKLNGVHFLLSRDKETCSRLEKENLTLRKELEETKERYEYQQEAKIQERKQIQADAINLQKQNKDCKAEIEKLKNIGIIMSIIIALFVLSFAFNLHA